MTLSKEQLGIIQHSLGVDQFGQGHGGRNNFFTGGTGSDVYLCESLCAYGLMKRDPRFPNDIFPDDCYRVTEAGKRILFSQCPKPPKKTAGQQRYEEWLSLSDCMDITFGHYLKNRKRIREQCYPNG